MSRPASSAHLRWLLLVAATALMACGGGDVHDTASRSGDEAGRGGAGAVGTGLSGASGHGGAGSPAAGQGGSTAGTGGASSAGGTAGASGVSGDGGASGVGGEGGEGGGEAGGAGGGASGAGGGVVQEPPACLDPSLMPRDSSGNLLCEPGFGVCGEGCYVPGEEMYPTTCLDADQLTEDQIFHMPSTSGCIMRQANTGAYCGSAYSAVTQTMVAACCYVGRVLECE